MLDKIQGFIQGVIDEPAAFVGVVFLLFVIFMIGYMMAWFFKGGVIKFLLGILFGYGAFISFMMGDMLSVKIAFAGGFLLRFFNWWQFLIRWQERILGSLVYRFETTVLDFLRSFFPNLLRRLANLKPFLHLPKRAQGKTDRNQQSSSGYQANKTDDFAQAQAKRAEEIKRERERMKNKGKQNQTDSEQSNSHEQAKTHYKKRSRQSNQKQRYKSDRYSTQKQGSQRSRSHQANQDSQRNKERLDGQKKQSSPQQPQQTVDNRTDLEVLGLVQGQTYTADEIKKAYREQSKKVHPDKWQGKPQAVVETMEQEMIRINQAYGNLK